MNIQIKKTIGKFLFMSVLISCITALAAGSVTVSERGNYNIFFTKYAVMSFSSSCEKIEAEYENNRLTLKVPVKKIKASAEKYVCLTPLCPVYYLLKSAGDIKILNYY